jgi:nucleotide sugar dehydrogenase
MKIAVIGAGRLGLCFALNLEKAGYEVVAYDQDLNYVHKLQTKIFTTSEPSVKELFMNSQIVFTNNYQYILNADVFFIMVNTPSLSDGVFDHKQIDQTLLKLNNTDKPICISSTVMPGYCSSKGLKNLVYSPQFIAQGSILENQTNPDIVLIGSDQKNNETIIQKIYKKLCKNNPKFFCMSFIEAEITKLALNCYITTKIAFANMIGDLCINAGAQPDLVLEAISADARIGEKSFKYGYGFGGPCFPRDNQALIKASESYAAKLPICESTQLANKQHLEAQIENINKGILPTNIFQEKDHLVMTDICYKQNCEIIEESQPLLLAEQLAKKYKIKIKCTSHVRDLIKNKCGSIFEYKI